MFPDWPVVNPQKVYFPRGCLLKVPYLQPSPSCQSLQYSAPVQSQCGKSENHASQNSWQPAENSANNVRVNWHTPAHPHFAHCLPYLFSGLHLLWSGAHLLVNRHRRQMPVTILLVCSAMVLIRITG